MSKIQNLKEKDNPEFKTKLNLKDKFILFLVFVFIVLFVWFFSNTNNLVLLGLILFVIFTYLVVLLIYIYFKYPHQNEKELFPNKIPTVAVVTYAFNNFKGVEKTVKKLCNLEYPIPYNVYVINDGTMEYLKKISPKVKLITLDKKYFKKGQNIKATIMNLGFKKLNEENILCTDGDTLPNKDVLMCMTGLLKEDVGAVIGFIKPTNKMNWIEKMQMFEYNLFFAFWNYSFSLMDSMFVVCGPLNLINRKRFFEVGGFDITNITEDADLAFAFRQSNYKLVHSLDAVAETDIPNTLKKFFRQRIRWYRGGFFTWLKYKHLFFKKKSGLFGNFIFPYIAIMNIIGMAFFAQVVWNSLKFIFTYLIPYIYNFIKLDGFQKFINYILNLSLNEIVNFYIYIPSTTTLVFFTFAFSLLLGILAFSFSNLKVNLKDLWYFILFSSVYPMIFTAVYLYSLILEFISYKYRW